MVTAEAVNKYTGTRRSKKKRGVTSKPQAKTIYKELWNICRNEKPGESFITHWGPLVERYLTDLESQVRGPENPMGISPKVWNSKKGHLMNHLGKWDRLHLDLITPHFANEELDDLERKGLSRTLTRNIFKNIKCIFGYAVECGILKQTPFDRSKNRKVPKKNKKALTHSEVKLFLSEAHKRKHSYYFVWLLALTLGLRRSELAGLKWTDIDFDKRLITVQRQLIPQEGLVEKTKGSADRVVAIPESIMVTMKEYHRRAKTEFVIENLRGTWSNGTQAFETRNFCRLIGIKEVTFHQLRATHITLALIDGVSIGIVKANVGHSKLSTTDEYFRSSGIEMQGKTDRLNIFVPES